VPALGWGLDPYGAVAGQSGSAASVASVASGVATITGLVGMSPLSVGQSLQLIGTASVENAGTFTITEYISASSVKVSNVNAIAPDGNNGSISWIARLQTQPSIYGSAVAGLGTSLQKALALSTNTIRVWLTAEPKHSSKDTVGDALNPSTWAVQRLDTTAFFHVVGVVAYTPLVYDVVVFEALGAVDVTHRVSSSTLEDVGGGLLRTPRHADFVGAASSAQSTSANRAATRRVASRDLYNYPADQGEAGVVGGTLQVTASGDYAEMMGADLLRKLIIRRLISIPGDFFHLPEYGVGLRGKEPTSLGNLPKLKAEIERQVLLEPEVESAHAVLTQDADTLTVQVRAKLRVSGQSLDVMLPVRQSWMSL